MYQKIDKHTTSLLYAIFFVFLAKASSVERQTVDARDKVKLSKISTFPLTDLYLRAGNIHQYQTILELEVAENRLKVLRVLKQIISFYVMNDNSEF